MDLTGIENEAEFFPAGTLSDVLEVELQDITGRWSRELEGADPGTRLSGSADTYLRLYRQLLNTTDKNLRNELYSQSVALVSTALGYEVKRSSETLALDAGSLARVMNKTFDADGKQALWIIEAPAPAAGEEQADPLGQAFDREQYDSDEQEHAELEKTIEELLADGIFGLPDAPRYVLVAGASQWVLVDQRKWPARSVLRFDLQEIFSRQDRDTFRVMACLVACEARVPATGIPIADRLEEEAQRNANAVTTSLKRTVRDAIEILGQEVLDVTGGKFPTGPKRGVWIDGPTLSLECLRYMYRLLFLLYAESSPRLRILDLKDPLYASGYSMEALRDLESVRLRTPQEKNGSYLWDSLQQVLTLLYSGENHVLKLPAVKVSLLDPESTPLLNSVSLRNEAVQKIIRQLSLRSSKKNTGRISYSKLGIGQLGAVYETLISFTGTVAKEDLIELKGDSKNRAAVETGAADDTGYETNNAEVDEEVESRVDKVDLLAPTYFVPRRRITEFNPEAVIFEGAQAKIYLKGSFTYRLSGRDREKTAAYYTPEPLARLLVKHLLMERCKDLAADEILELKILEPAMGSAAFLVETTNQLTDLYLERKQVEVGRVIPQEDILLEKQKVRSYIADRNCFGVDLNPTAVELGAISLWLNGLHKSDFSPWFGDQLHAGNSLIGARRAVYPSSQLRGRTTDLWFKNPPKEISWKEERPESTVYQWLLPAGDMAAFEKDNTIREFAGDHQARIKAWRAGGFFKPLEPHEISLVKRLTKVADELFDIVASELERTRDAANDEITLWPDKTMSGAKDIGYQKKEIMKQRLLGEDHAENTLPFKRLKTAMDAWCALWLWPIEQADKLPSRQEFLEGMRILLEGGFSVDGSLSAGAEDDFAVVIGDLFDQQLAEPARKYNVGLFQETNVEAFIEEYDWLQVAAEVANEARFVHYDLIFADILKARGGFDLIVGNPPWARSVWSASRALEEIDSLYAGLPASQAKKLLAKEGFLSQTDVTKFITSYCNDNGSNTFISSSVNFPLASSGSQNIYRNFSELAWSLMSNDGNSALIHMDAHLGTPNADLLREVWYRRARKYFEFSNQIKNKNFAEVMNTKWFSLNIYGSERSPSFDIISSCFLARQVDECYTDEGISPVMGPKNAGEWNVNGHKSRVVKVDSHYLEDTSKLFDQKKENPRFLKPYDVREKSLFSKLSENPAVETIFCDLLFGFGVAERTLLEAGVAERTSDSLEVNECDRFFITPSHCSVATLMFKQFRHGGSNYKHYDAVDPQKIPGKYRGRSPIAIHRIASEVDVLKNMGYPIAENQFFVAFKCWVDTGAERTLVAFIAPPEAVVSENFMVVRSDILELFSLGAVLCSITSDFIVKRLKIEHIYESTITKLPACNPPESATLRMLILSSQIDLFSGAASYCLRSLSKFCDHYYSPILFSTISEKTSLLDRNGFLSLSILERKLIEIEIDVLIAMALGLNAEDLDVMLLAFPLLEQNDNNTFYFPNGNLAFSSATNLRALNFFNGSSREWQAHLQSEGFKVATPSKFQRDVDYLYIDRFYEYKTAWTYFEKLEQEGKL